VDLDHLRVMLATDCGSTTSKARFFRKIGNEYRFVASGEAPTTVEAPYEDVTMGVRNAVREVEELTGHKILAPGGIISPSRSENEGVDLYVTTSSAGGGLQMVCTGVARAMTAESAERAALGAGAIVMDVVSSDEQRSSFDKIKKMRAQRPDMILFAGGTDGGSVQHVMGIGELIKMARPQHRLGAQFKLPVVYAGNRLLRDRIKQFLGEDFALSVVDNIRPTLDTEVVGPSRDAIHELFMEHVMSHAPGYDKLMKWTDVSIMPTPAGEGIMFQTIAKMYQANVIGVGLGGATTNIYSIFDGKFVRSVSANLGMSYSISNVLKQTGIGNITRWLPFESDENVIINKLRNKMIRPTTIPQTLEDLVIEHAVAREALRMGFIHHKSIARPLSGFAKGAQLDFGSVWGEEESYIDMMKIGWLGGTGGLLSHAPRRAQSALILLDGFQVEGIVNLIQDSVFMMPHLGVLSTVHPKAAMEIFEKDCMVRLGTCLAFRGNGQGKVASLRINMPDGRTLDEEVESGTIKRIPLGVGEKADIEINPTRRFDIGSGGGHRFSAKAEGGEVGIIIDARGRPLTLPENASDRRKKLIEWYGALEAYPKGLQWG